MTKIISVLLSAVMLISSASFSSLPDVIDTVFSAFTGVPLLESSVNSDFLDEINDDEIEKITETSGYCKNTVMLFIDEDASIFQKIRLFRNEPMLLLGWSCPANLYVARYYAKGINAIKSYCDYLTEAYDAVALAVPVTASKVAPDYTPDDPFDTDEKIVWDELNPDGANWWLETLEARQAWDYADFMDIAMVGVCDSGFNPMHEDFTKEAYIPNRFVMMTADIVDHGNHVIGIISAQHNNGTGIAGVIPNAKIMFYDWEPNPLLLQFWSTDLHIIFGFIDLVKSGAKVLNFSLGSAGSISKNKSENEFLYKSDSAVHSALISILLSKGYDFVVCQSAGNGNEGSYPVDAKYNGTFAGITEENAVSLSKEVTPKDIADRVIIVSSVDLDGKGGYVQSEYSNVGKHVSIAAPGDNIYSLDASEYNYFYASGTSMSAPMVTGVAGLVWSINPDFTGAQVKSIVCGNTNKTAVPVAQDMRRFENLDYVNYNIVNARLSVEAALCQTYPMGRVNGSVEKGGKPACSQIKVKTGSTETTHTVYSDGSFTFVAPEGSGTVSGIGADGKELFSKEIKISKNGTLDLGNLIPAENAAA